MPGHAWRARPAAAYMTQTVLECNKMVERGQNFHAAKEQSLPSPTQSSGDERGRPVIGGVPRARLRPEWMPARHRRDPPYSHPAGPSACLWLSADDRSEPASTTCPLGSNRERLGLIPMFQKIETSLETGFAADVQAFASRLAGEELRRIGGDALHCLAADMGALS